MLNLCDLVDKKERVIMKKNKRNTNAMAELWVHKPRFSYLLNDYCRFITVSTMDAEFAKILESTFKFEVPMVHRQLLHVGCFNCKESEYQAFIKRISDKNINIIGRP